MGGSDKSIEVFDMNVGKGVMTWPNAQERPVHCIAQNKVRTCVCVCRSETLTGMVLSFLVQGSKFISHPSSGYDLFLTSAVTDGVKLWDLRQSR